MTDAPENTIGLSKFGGWFDLMAGGPLEEQLDKEGVQYRTFEVTNIFGMGGCARLIGYKSPSSGLPVVTLVIPIRGDVDSFGEDYFVFIGLEFDDAVKLDDWASRYDACKEIVKQSAGG